MEPGGRLPDSPAIRVKKPFGMAPRMSAEQQANSNIAGPLVVGDVPPPPQFSDVPPPVRLSGELAIEVDHGDTRTASVVHGK
jgi:hypothetical protein